MINPDVINPPPCPQGVNRAQRIEEACGSCVYQNSPGHTAPCKTCEFASENFKAGEKPSEWVARVGFPVGCHNCKHDDKEAHHEPKQSSQIPPKAPPLARTADEIQVGGTHYKDMALQPWDVMHAVMSHEEFIGFLKGNIIKYSMRAGLKQGANDDADKARHYRQKLREVNASS